MRILFCTEGSKNIGMGALYDCLILAKRFSKKCASKIKFLLSHKSQRHIEKVLFKGYSISRINMGNTRVFLNSIAEFKPNIIVHNLLRFKEDYISGLNRFKTCIVNISHKPDFKEHLKADLVINLLYDLSGTKCLYGPKYAILGDKFRDLNKREIKDIANNLLISFGGADVNNLSFKLIKLLDKLDVDFCANVVIGAGFKDGHKLQRCLNSLINKERFIINKKVADMLSLMLSSDLAFVSGGRTICELAATGTPGIAFAQNELEYARLKEFQKWGSVLNYGYLGNNEAKLILDIKGVILNKPRREAMSRKGQELVDGKGAERIIEAIIEYHKKAPK